MYRTITVSLNTYNYNTLKALCFLSIVIVCVFVDDGEIRGTFSWFSDIITLQITLRILGTNILRILHVYLHIE